MLPISREKLPLQLAGTVLTLEAVLVVQLALGIATPCHHWQGAGVAPWIQDELAVGHKM